MIAREESAKILEASEALVEVSSPQSEAGFASMKLNSFVAGRPAMVDLYHVVQGRYVLFCEASSLFPSTSKIRLLRNDIDKLYVRVKKGQVDTGNRSLPELLSLPDEQLSSQAKGELLYNSALVATERVMGAPRLTRLVQAARQWVATSVTYLARDPASFRAMVKVMGHDYAIYTHSVNTCVYATAMGVAKGKSKDELLQLGIGALLHDIGKTMVPEETLNKPAALDAEEWRVMRRHSEWGVEILSEGGYDQPDVRAIVLEHHERLDGSGYPYGLVAHRINPLASIVAVADVYDALTCERPYRRRMTPFEALQIIKQQTSTKLDYSLFASLVVMLGQDIVAPSAPVMRKSSSCRWD